MAGAVVAETLGCVSGLFTLEKWKFFTSWSGRRLHGNCFVRMFSSDTTILLIYELTEGGWGTEGAGNGREGRSSVSR